MSYKTRLKNVFNAASASFKDDLEGKANVAVFTMLLGGIAFTLGLPLMPLAMVFGAAAGVFVAPPVIAGCRALKQEAPSP